MQLVQRECNDRQTTQLWRLRQAPPTRAPASSSIAPVAISPDPAEYPGGGKDKPCEGLAPVLNPATEHWSSQPFLIRNENAALGKIALGPGAAGEVELLRANRTSPEGIEETFYWAEGFVKFTPRQFTMALQWTTLPGPGGWHTCSITFTVEFARPQTVALPRDLDHDGIRDVAFRVCLSYQTEHTADRAVNCTERYGKNGPTT